MRRGHLTALLALLWAAALAGAIIEPRHLHAGFPLLINPDRPIFYALMALSTLLAFAILFAGRRLESRAARWASAAPLLLHGFVLTLLALLISTNFYPSAA